MDLTERLRWKLWDLLTRSRRVCPASAHGLLLRGQLRSPLVSGLCRADCARTGSCYCGQLRRPS